LRYVTPYGRCGISSEDVAMEIALRALKVFKGYDPARGKFSTWLTVVARSAAHTMRVKATAEMRSAKTIHASGSVLFQHLPDPREPVEVDEVIPSCWDVPG